MRTGSYCLGPLSLSTSWSKASFLRVDKNATQVNKASRTQTWSFYLAFSCQLPWVGIMPTSVFALLSCFLFTMNSTRSDYGRYDFCACLRHITHLSCRDCYKDDPEAPRPQDTSSWRSWRMLNVSLAHASETLELWQSLNLWLWLSAVLWRHAVYSAVRMDEVLLPIQFWGFFESGKDDQLSWFSCRNLHERKLDQIQNIAELKVSPFLSLKSIWHTWPHLKSDSAGPRFYMGISCSTFNELAVVGVKDIRKQAAPAKESSWVQRFAETRWCLYWTWRPVQMFYWNCRLSTFLSIGRDSKPSHNDNIEHARAMRRRVPFVCWTILRVLGHILSVRWVDRRLFPVIS